MASPTTNSAACRERRDRGDHLYQNCPKPAPRRAATRCLDEHHSCDVTIARLVRSNLLS